jgi:hypothetical protein
MSDTYTKLFRSITASTIVSEPLATRWLWVTLLSQADSAGCVWGSVPGIARLANITLEECELALACLYSPDPYSRTQDHEGRRIEAIDGGWRLLNHAKYDAIRNEAERAEYKREWDRRNRPSGHARQSDKSPTVRQESDTSPTKSDSPTPPALTPTLTTRALDQEQKKAPASAVARPEGVAPQTWTDWLTLRKAKKAAVTETALNGIRREAERAGVTLNEALSTCCERGWTGFKADWLKPDQRAGPVNGAKPSAAASFRGKTYTGTPIDDIPESLRPT